METASRILISLPPPPMTTECQHDSKYLSCHADDTVVDHFVDVTEMIILAKGAKREISDYKLSRYACYLIAQSGDPEKVECAHCGMEWLPSEGGHKGDGTDCPECNKLIKSLVAVKPAEREQLLYYKELRRDRLINLYARGASSGAGQSSAAIALAKKIRELDEEIAILSAQ